MHTQQFVAAPEDHTVVFYPSMPDKGIQKRLHSARERNIPPGSDRLDCECQPSSSKTFSPELSANMEICLCHGVCGEQNPVWKAVGASQVCEPIGRLFVDAPAQRAAVDDSWLPPENPSTL